MGSWVYRMAAAAALFWCVVILPGCCWQVQRVRIINESTFPVTSVRLIPYCEDEAEQEAAMETASNLLPKDSTGNTIALAPGSEVSSWFLRKHNRYIRAVTFFVDAAYSEHIQKSVLDLSDTPAHAMLVIRVKSQADAP